MKFFKMVMFTKEGKGVEKDEPQKRAFFRFWEQVWQKKYKLMAVNIMYVISNILSVILCGLSYMVAVSLYFTLTPQEVPLTELLMDTSKPQYMDMFMMGLCFVLVLFTSIPVFANGPCQSGFMYIIKNFVKQEPVFLWHDFITKTRSNFKLSLKVCLINAFVGFMIMIDYAVYLALSSQEILSGTMTFLIFILLLFFTVAFLIMNMYIYPMIVIFNISLKQLYKNAMIFSVLKWLPNIGILLLNIALPLIPLLFIDGYFAFYISMFLYFFISVAFKGFLNTFYVYPQIKKFMIDNPVADVTKMAELEANGGLSKTNSEDIQDDLNEEGEDL